MHSSYGGHRWGKWRRFSDSKQLVHGRLQWDRAGIAPINSNKILTQKFEHSKIQYIVHFYICIYMKQRAGQCLWGEARTGRAPRVGDSHRFKPTTLIPLTSGHSPSVSSVFSLRTWRRFSPGTPSFLHLNLSPAVCSFLWLPLFSDFNISAHTVLA